MNLITDHIQLLICITLSLHVLMAAKKLQDATEAANAVGLAINIAWNCYAIYWVWGARAN